MAGTTPRLWKLPLARRVEQHRASRNFGTVLALIIVSFVFAASAPDSDWTTSVLVLLQSVTLVAALWTSGLARADSWLSIGFLAIAIGAATISLVVGGSTLSGVVALIAGLMSICVVLVLGRSITHAREVNAQSIQAAICIYIMLGMVFLFAYGAIATARLLAVLRAGDGRDAGRFGSTSVMSRSPRSATATTRRPPTSATWSRCPKR